MMRLQDTLEPLNWIRVRTFQYLVFCKLLKQTLCIKLHCQLFNKASLVWNSQNFYSKIIYIFVTSSCFYKVVSWNKALIRDFITLITESTANNHDIWRLKVMTKILRIWFQSLNLNQSPYQIRSSFRTNTYKDIVAFYSLFYQFK